MIKSTFFVLLLCTLLSVEAFAVTVTGSAGTVTSTGGGISWTGTGNLGATDGSVATSSSRLANNGDVTQLLSLTNFGFNIPSTSVITGVTVQITRKNSANAAALFDNNVNLIVGGASGSQNRALGAGWNNVYATISYGGTNDMWGESLTYTSINASNFGFNLSVFRNGTGSANQFPEIDFAQISISYNSTLPVELISFTAEALYNGDRKLCWSTATEINSSKYHLQRADGHADFETIAEIRAAGNTQEKTDYEYFDTDYSREEVLYYRLVQEDFDGTQETFKVVSVEPVIRDEFSVYPNPAVNLINLNVREELLSEIESVLIFSYNGTLIETIPYQKSNSVDLSRYPEGNYLIKILFKNSTKPELHRFIKL